MMQFNHINLQVPDGLATAPFFTDRFGMSPLPGLKPTKRMAILRDEAGMVFNRSNFNADAAVDYPEIFHIGSVRNSRAGVDAMHRRLVVAGHDAPAPKSVHGAWTFFMTAPGGVTVKGQCGKGDPGRAT
jgi:hypothetical protein